jgi:hypothetical protein
MSAATTNLIIDQGATWNITFTYKNADGGAINLTNHTAALQLRTSYDAESPSLSLSSPSNGIVLGGTAGTIAVTATATQTGSLTAGEYVYDLEITSSSVVTRLVQGRITVTPQVTR